MAKNVYKNGTEFINKETKQRVRFLKWLDDNTANCLDKEMNFIQIKRDDLDQNYQSVAAMNKGINERRRNQMWSY